MSEVELWFGQLDVGVLVHGGAGSVARDRRELHVRGATEAANAGYAVLAAGGSALDAVVAAARALEDAPQFNAGTGAALNEAGEVEHDAALMNGADLRAGAVGALVGFKNPIDVARALLEDGRHVLLAGEGARSFALAHGLSSVDPASLITDHAREALARLKKGGGERGWAGGTIGAVARDALGHVAAATSTGGTIGKLRGRVGDSPILGAGTLADDASCAISATGDGEAILRIGLARGVALDVERGVSAADASRAWISRVLDRTGARVGSIVVDRTGAFAAARSTATMAWAARGRSLDLSGI